MTTDRRTWDLDELLDATPRDVPPVVVTRQCAWCGTVLTQGTPGAGTTHTVCDDCDRKYLTEDAA